MSFSQFDFYLLPRAEVAAHLGRIPSCITQEELNSQEYWTETQPVKGYADRFSAWRRQIPAWDPALRWWGSEIHDRIDVWMKKGRVTEVDFRIDVLKLDLGFIQLMVDVARDSSCILLSESGDVVEPLRGHVLNHLVQSNRVNEVWDYLRGPTAPSSDGKVPRIFLSHSSLDKPFVSKLAVDLRSRNVPVWYDQWELKVGDSLSARIAEGISESGWLAIVLSKNSVSSAWVQRELNTALAIELGQKDVFILPLVIDDCDIPAFLLDKLYADFRISYQEGMNALLSRVFHRPSA